MTPPPDSLSGRIELVGARCGLCGEWVYPQPGEDNRHTLRDCLENAFARIHNLEQEAGRDD
jgi:hypothetical protein